MLDAHARVRILVLLLIPLSGCLSSPAAGRGSAGPGLRQAATEWIRTFPTGNADRIAGFFAEDAVAHYPGWERPVVGRAANREAWAGYFGRRRHHPMRLDTVIVSASNDLGYVMGRGLYAEESDPDATGGRWVGIWRRFGAEWKLVVLAAHNHSDVTSATFRSR